MKIRSYTAKTAGTRLCFPQESRISTEEKTCRSQNAVNVAEQSKKTGGLLFGEEAQNV